MVRAQDSLPREICKVHLASLLRVVQPSAIARLVWLWRGETMLLVQARFKERRRKTLRPSWSDELNRIEGGPFGV